MLVLTRKVGQSIVISGTIRVLVLRVEGGRVKIGISAPPEVTVMREELLAGQANARATEADQQG